MSNSKFSDSPAKFLSIFVDRMVPDYVREDHPMFITFMRKYFEYLERETSVNGELGEYKQIADLMENVDIDHSLDQFIPEFEKQYLASVPKQAIDPTIVTTDKAFLTKNIKKTYKEKGTANSLNFLFRRDFDTTADIIYPKQWMMKASGSVWYEPKWIETDEEADLTPFYNKKIIGQTSGATAFVDIDEDDIGQRGRLNLTEINGIFLQGEEIIVDVGEQDIEPDRIVITSAGIIAPGTCYINGTAWDVANNANTPENKEECIEYKGVEISTTNSNGDTVITAVETAVWLPNGYWLDSTGFLSSDKKLQDNEYFQDFSYVVRSSVPVQAYREVLKKLVHPVGLKLFAEYLFDSEVEMAILLPEGFSKYIISIFLYLDVAMDIWTPGQGYGQYHGRNHVWTRPKTFRLQEPLVIPADVPLWDGTINLEDIVIPMGSCTEDMSWNTFNTPTELECAGVTNPTTGIVGVWTPTDIETNLGENNRGKQLVRQDYVLNDLMRIQFDLLGISHGPSNEGNARGFASDEWTYLPEHFKNPELYTKKEDEPFLGKDHQGFEMFLDNGYDDYVIEILKHLEVDTGLVDVSDWGKTYYVDKIPHPGDHFSVSYQSPVPHRIGNFLKEKLYTISSMNDKLEFAEAIGDGFAWTKEDTYQLVDELTIPAGVRLYDGTLSTEERKLPVGLCNTNGNGTWQDFLIDSGYAFDLQNDWYPATESECVALNESGLNPTIPFNEYIPTLNIIPDSVDNATWFPTIIETQLDFPRLAYVNELGQIVEQEGYNTDEWKYLPAEYKREIAGCNIESVDLYNFCSDADFESQFTCESPRSVWGCVNAENPDDPEEVICSCDDPQYTDEGACIEPNGYWTVHEVHYIDGQDDCIVSGGDWRESVYTKEVDNIAKTDGSAGGLFNAWPETTILEFSKSLLKESIAYLRPEQFLVPEDITVLADWPRSNEIRKGLTQEEWDAVIEARPFVEDRSDYIIDAGTIITTSIPTRRLDDDFRGEWGDSSLAWIAVPYVYKESSIYDIIRGIDYPNKWPLKVLDFTQLPPAATILDLTKTYKGFKNIDPETGLWDGSFNTEFKATDARMIGCEVWDLLVSRGMETILKWITTFVHESDYAPEKSYRNWELNRENSAVQHIYGLACDIIDSVTMNSFEENYGENIHTHGGKDGFAPSAETTLTKGLELPLISVGISAFHGHDFDNETIKNLVVHGKEVITRTINFDEARRLINKEYFEVPEMMGANLVCGGIMTPPLWGDWVDSHTDDRYNGYGECFNSAYDNPTDCIAAYGGNPMFWMPPMCSNMSNMSQDVCEGMSDTWVANPPSSCSDGTSPDHIQCEGAGGTWTWETPSYCTSSEASCNAVGHSWGYFTLADLPAMKGHKSHFVEGQLVDKQRGRTADPLSREQARQLIDGDLTSVTLYDNVGYLDDGMEVQTDGYGVTDGGTITNIRGEITSGHYHEYEVTYDADWENLTDWQNNPLTHGFIYTPITTWLCFNYRPDLPVDPTAMGGMDFLGNQWPQNVFMEIPDSYIAGFLMNPDITLQHNQVWDEELNPNVDWVELYSSNHIAEVPGVGATGDLIGVDLIGTDTDIATIESFPLPYLLTSSERAMWIHVTHTVMDHMNGITTAHTDLWAYLLEVMPDGYPRIDFNKDGVINQLDLDEYSDEIYKERIIDDAYSNPAIVANFSLDATTQYPFAIVDQSGYIKLMNDVDGDKTLLLDLTSLQHVIGLGSFANYDERGVLGLAFHPDYANNGKFYVYYMTEQGGGTGAWGFPLSSTVISEFTAGEDKFAADISSERILMTIPQPDFNHNGGELAFGPDGMLYIGLGDGGSAGDTSWATGHGGHGPYGNAQNPTNLLGNILRIDVTEDVVNGMPYTIPADNPFVNHIYKEGQAEAEAYKPEIWAMGFRNPWRFSFDITGRLWAADVGQDKFEEINIVEKGGNYGWRVIEAYHEFELDQGLIDQIAIDLGYPTTVEYMLDLKKPIHEYSHGTGISILGGFVYRGSIVELQGKYIFGDWSTNWGGTSGHLYTLTENFDGNSAHFNVLANPVNGATHGHTIDLTGSEVQFLKDNPGQTITTVQSDLTHAEFYTHTFTIIWSSQYSEFVIIGQTNPEGHDVLEFVSYGTDLAYDRTPLSIWNPDTEVVDLTTMGESILTMGETVDGEIIFATRLGINTFQAPYGAGPNNTTMYKITDLYNSVDIPNAPEQIPSSETAHVHGYEVTYDHIVGEFNCVEISDIQMENWDSFWPVWTHNDPASHVHPTDTAWSHRVDDQIPIGASAGWRYNEDTGLWEPYDIGADTAWAPPSEETSGYTYILTAPTISIGYSNEFAKSSHQHYLSNELLDTFGVNYGRTSKTISREEAELLANEPEGTKVTLFSSIHVEEDQKRHYHQYEVIYNSATKQFYSIEISEWTEGVYGTGEFFKLDEQTHEHPTSVDGILSSVGWSGEPVFEAPLMIVGGAHDWLNLSGSEPDHIHQFDDLPLDGTGVNVGRRSTPMTTEQTTKLKNGTLDEVVIYSSALNNHYHAFLITYQPQDDSFEAQEIEMWSTGDGVQYTLDYAHSHMHPISVDGIITGTGYSETIVIEDMPEFDSPGYPYPGGTHPHFHEGTVVGPFPDGSISYAGGLTTTEAAQLIDGIITTVTIYDSLEGAHFHEYRIKWNDDENIFYCYYSATWIRGGIEDGTQDPLKYYLSVLLNSAEGLHWHNLTIDWNPNDTAAGQQIGGSVYVTRVVSTDEVLLLDPVVTQSSTSTELNPVETTYANTPGFGDTTIIFTYSDQITTTTTTTSTTNTTTTIVTYLSDGSDSFEVLPTVVSTSYSDNISTTIVEDETERKTYVNDILQANISPVIWIDSTFIDGEGSHDHLLYDGCTLDTEGVYAGRICAPISLDFINQLVNAQDPNFGIVFYDSPNGNLSHYHSYALKYNPGVGEDGLFTVSSLSMFDRIEGTGTTIHKFLLSGGFHTHDYWCTESEYANLVAGGSIEMIQRDGTHADIYTHTVTVSYNGIAYNIVGQTSDFDGHNVITYQGQVALGGEWVETAVQPGDHIHTTIIDDSNTWPVPV